MFSLSMKDRTRIIGLFAPQGYGKTMLSCALMKQFAKHINGMIYDTDFEKKKFARLLRPTIHDVYVIEPEFNRRDDLSYLREKIIQFRATHTNEFFWITDLEKVFYNTNSLSAEADEIKKFASDGRKQRLHLGYETKQAKVIPTALMASTNLFFFGNFSETADLKALSSIIDVKLLRNLKDNEFLYYDRWTLEKGYIKVNNGKFEVRSLITREQERAEKDKDKEVVNEDKDEDTKKEDISEAVSLNDIDIKDKTEPTDKKANAKKSNAEAQKRYRQRKKEMALKDKGKGDKK